MSRKQNNKFSGNKRGVKTSAVKGTITSNYADSLVVDYGNLNYSYLPGANFFGGLDYSGNVVAEAEGIPGLMSFPVVPTIGISKDATSPINLAARQIYTKNRSVNSGAKNYDPNNMMIYLMAMDGVYSFHSWMCRLYQAMFAYTANNYYLPYAMIEAMGMSIYDLSASIEQLKAYINLFSRRANQICVPDVLPIIKNHARMFNCVYNDEESIVGQMYMFNPAGYYLYNENVSSGEKFGSLKYTEFTGSTLREIISFGNTMLNDLLESEDMALIAGDLTKAFGENGMLTLPSEPNSELQVVYDADVLLALNNANTLALSNLVVGDITALGTNSFLEQEIYYEPDIEGDRNLTLVSPVKQFINQRKEKPDVQDNLMACRFKFFAALNGAEDKFIFQTMGPEILGHPKVYNYVYQNNGRTRFLGSQVIPFTMVINYEDIPNFDYEIFINELEQLTAFRNAPALNLVNIVTTTNQARIVDYWKPIIDWYNPTILDKDVLTNIHLSMFMCEFNV